MSRVHVFHVEYAFRRLADVEIRRDDCRRLAAQLQRHRRQVLRGGLHDGLSRSRRPGENQMVEGQRGEFPGRDTRQKGYEVFGDDPGYQALQEAAESLGVGSHLDHAPVPRRKGGCQRADGELQGIVPRRDDAHHAFRLGDDAVSRSHEPERHMPVLRPRP